MSNSYSEKAHPSSIYICFNTRYVIPLFSYTDTLFEWSQMKIIQLEFPIFWYETFLCLKQVYCCLTFVCVYIFLYTPSSHLIANGISYSLVSRCEQQTELQVCGVVFFSHGIMCIQAANGFYCWPYISASLKDLLIISSDSIKNDILLSYAFHAFV